MLPPTTHLGRKGDERVPLHPTTTLRKCEGTGYMDSSAGPSSEQALGGPLTKDHGFLEPLHPRNEEAWGPTPLHLLITNAGGRRAVRCPTFPNLCSP